MSAMIDTSNGRINFAYSGDGAEIWWNPPAANRLPDGASLDDYLKMGGLTHTYEKAQAFVSNNGNIVAVPDQYFIRRRDNGFVTSGSVSEQYKIHQPREQAEAFRNLIEVSDKLRMSSAASLDFGRRMFLCAEYQDNFTVAGDNFKAFLLASTSFDATLASILSCSLVRTICKNTQDAALAAAGKNKVKTNHRTHYDAKQAAEVLAAILQQTTKFKKVGDAMALVQQSEKELAAYFKQILNIDPKLEGKAEFDKLSTRLQNSYTKLWQDYQQTTKETDKGTAWAAFQTVTRFVDHDRSVKHGGLNEHEARFISAQYGTGAALKQKAWDLLMPAVLEKVAA
jgi:phage/plasmid-like protein (TIGR03299 family)